jgi:ketosteroid isomerase-like protein
MIVLFNYEEDTCMTRELSAEDRLQILEDKEEIRETIYRYAWQLDKKEWDDLTKLFCDDAILIVHPYGVHEGRDAIRSFFLNILDKRPAGFHYVSNIVVTVSGNLGKSDSFWHSTGEREGRSMVVAGFYHHELIKREDCNWYIKKKEIYIDYNVPLKVGWAGLRGKDRIWGDSQGKYTPPKKNKS